MLKFFSKQMNNKKGFTLIELIVVIAILAILALIAIPRIGKFRTNAAISSHNANVRTLESAASMYLAEEGLPTNTIKWNGTENSAFSNEWKDYIADWPEIPSGLKNKTMKDVTNKEINFGTEYEVEIEYNATTNKVTVEVAPELFRTATQ